MKNAILLTAVLLLGLASGYWLAQYAPASLSLNEESGSADKEAQQSDVAIDDVTPRYRSGPFHFDIEVDPAKPVVGSNQLTLMLFDRDENEPVTGARLKAVAEMPAMGDMPAMRTAAEMTETQPGVYIGEFEPSMKGEWPLTVEVEHDELGSTRFTFSLATGRQGLSADTGASRIDGNGDKAEQVEAPTGTITVDARRRQQIGVTFGEARRRDLSRSIRAVGRVAYDETRLSDVSLKYDVWIGELKADYVGEKIKRGQLLFTIYSPALYSAQQEYLDIRRRSQSGVLLEAARQRLRLWNMAASTIDELEKRGKPFEYIPIYAPRDGTLVAKNINEGTAQKAGQTLLRIADLSRVWVEADLYEAELPLVEPGMTVDVRLPYLPGERYESQVEHVYPYLDERSRTGRIRLSLANENGHLKPDMYAEVEIAIPLGERLSVPEEAVLVAGKTRVVFEDLGDGRLAPRRVQTGHRTDDYVEILNGLQAGARVVTSGNFLIAAESKLKAGIKQW